MVLTGRLAGRHAKTVKIFARQRFLISPSRQELSTMQLQKLKPKTIDLL